MGIMLITNNPAADGKYSGSVETVYLAGADLASVLRKVRDMVHEGHALLTHPLSGSVKPGQTCYKSVAVTREKGALDEESLEIIESSIAVAEKLLEDYRLIDLDLISGALDK